LKLAKYITNQCPRALLSDKEIIHTNFS